MPLRHALIRARRGFLLMALLCILLARVAVPAGWMPMAGADGGITLAPCSGMGAMTLAAHAMPGMTMDGMQMADMKGHHDSGEGHAAKDQRHPDPGGDHPCSGAGVSVALETPFAVAPVALVLRPVTTGIQSFVVTIGQGLAAPPPPQTGPPILV